MFVQFRGGEDYDAAGAIPVFMISRIVGLGSSTVDKRHDAAVRKIREGGQLQALTSEIMAIPVNGPARIEESKAGPRCSR